MLTIKKFWDGHCALPVPIPLGACGTYVQCTLSYTLFSPFRRLWTYQNRLMQLMNSTGT